MSVTARSRYTKKRRWQGLLAGGLGLLVAAGILYYRFPFSLQGGDGVVQPANSKTRNETAETLSAVSSLRGTIYDRNNRELAVSYRLYTLEVHPAKIRDHHGTANRLAVFTGKSVEEIEQQLSSAQRTVHLLDDLDEQQAAEITDMHLQGVVCTPTEHRFYPAHTMAAHLLGFTDSGVGLAGVEAAYDELLQPKDVRGHGATTTGGLGVTKSTDLVLTIDLEQQQELERALRRYLEDRPAARGVGMMMETGSGAIVALASMPGFNPNYFWNADEVARKNSFHAPLFDPGLLNEILLRAAAAEACRVGRGGLPPVTVASSDFGLGADAAQAYGRRVGEWEEVGEHWDEELSRPADSLPKKKNFAGKSGLSAMQTAITLTSLVNGGWRLTPYTLAGAFDPVSGDYIPRKIDTTRRRLVLEPTTGVRVRRALLKSGGVEVNIPQVFVAQTSAMEMEGQFSRHVRQVMVFGTAPVSMPKYMLLLAVDLEGLDPPDTRKSSLALTDVGRSLLAGVVASQPRFSAVRPEVHSPENMNRFLLGRRLGSQGLAAPLAHAESIMPDVEGLSLRRGLQQLSLYDVMVRVKGSGRIVAQHPSAGTSLLETTQCTLTLESRI